MSVNAILAVDNNFGIGYENKLPWPHNKKDMKWFRDNTQGHVVVMGRKTWESFGSKPLPNRVNLVVSKSTLEVQGADRTYGGDMEYILHHIKNLRYPDLHIWVIGGAEIYRQALPHCDKLYITMMHKAYKCDTFMRTSDFDPFINLEYEDKDENMTIQIRSK